MTKGAPASGAGRRPLATVRFKASDGIMSPPSWMGGHSASSVKLLSSNLPVISHAVFCRQGFSVASFALLDSAPQVTVFIKCVVTFRTIGQGASHPLIHCAHQGTGAWHLRQTVVAPEEAVARRSITQNRVSCMVYSPAIPARLLHLHCPSSVLCHLNVQGVPDMPHLSKRE